MKYFLSIGSNIEATKNIDSAIKELGLILSNVNKSSTYQTKAVGFEGDDVLNFCLLYTSPSPRDATLSRMPSSA